MVKARRLVALTAFVASLAIPATAAAKPNPLSDRYAADLGRSQYYPQMPAALDRARDAGIGWARVITAYNEVEPAPNQFDWAESDALVSQLGDRHVRILARLTPAVWWNTTAPSSAAGHYQDYPPADYDAYARYVTDVISHYKNSIHHWEIGNEMDTQTFWHSTPAEYAHLLAVSHDAIKAADPDAKIVIGGVVSRRAPEWLAAILNDPVYPAGRNFDIAAFHSYQNFDSLARPYADGIAAELAQDGVGDRPLWVTETGASVNASEQLDPQYQGPEGQAAWLRARMRLLSEAGAEKVFWFKLMDLVEPDERNELGLTHSALLDYSLNPRPAYGAYADLIVENANAEIHAHARYRHGKLKLKLGCPVDATYDRCKGKLRVRSANRIRSKRAHRPTLASGRYSVQAADQRSVKAGVKRRWRSRVARGLAVEVKAKSKRCPTRHCTAKLELRAPG